MVRRPVQLAASRRSGRPIPVLFAAALLLLAVPNLAVRSAADEAGVENPPATDPSPAVEAIPPISFLSEIQPILLRRCIECHGPEKQDGGLRVDDRESLARGGDSGVSVLGTPLDRSELYRRITAPQATERMPLGHPALPAAEIELIRRWIEQGAAWPLPPELPKVEDELTFWQVWLIRLERYLLPAAELLGRMRGVMAVAIAAMVVVLLIERAKVLVAREHRWSQGRAKRVFGLASRVGRTWYLVALLGFVIAGLWTYVGLVREEADSLRAKLAPRMRAEEEAVANPQPIRPHHPPRLGGTYYRGNDERNPTLYNRGAYRTCTFTVKLVDEDRRPLEVGDVVGGKSLLVHLDILRAKNASGALFTELIMSTVLLSRQRIKGDDASVRDTPLKLETLTPDHHWEALYPIGKAGPEGQPLEGMIFVYHGADVDQHDPQRLKFGEAHYGISYKIVLDDGKLAPESEIWMGAVFFPGTVHVPQENEVPLTEWFDFQPIPEVDDQPAVNPDLIGIPEHIEKGHIPPPEQKPKKQDEKPADPPATSEPLQNPAQSEP